MNSLFGYALNYILFQDDKRIFIHLFTCSNLLYIYVMILCEICLIIR